jgi:hypothetical protein
MADILNPQQQQPQHDQAFSDAGTENRTDEQKKADAELAERLAALIEDANRRVLPVCKMIRQASVFSCHCL